MMILALPKSSAVQNNSVTGLCVSNFIIALYDRLLATSEMTAQ